MGFKSGTTQQRVGIRVGVHLLERGVKLAELAMEPVLTKGERITVIFAHPCSLQEQEIGENVSGLLRRELAKGPDLSARTKRASLPSL